MAFCEYCKKDMEKADSCVNSYVVIGGKKYKRNTKYYDVNERCHDCNIINGRLHHFGCDMEKCPKCGGQFAFCDCKKDIVYENK